MGKSCGVTGISNRGSVCPSGDSLTQDHRDREVPTRRRVLDLVRQIEMSALQVREGELPDLGLELGETSIDVALPTDRPLFTARPAAEVDRLLDSVDTSVLTDQAVVVPARLATRIRVLIPVRGTARLEGIVTMCPLQHGAAEIVGYLALKDDDVEVATNDHVEPVIQYHEAGRSMRAVMPRVEVRRRCPHTTVPQPTPATERAVAVSANHLMQGVVYKETDAWDDLVCHQGMRIRLVSSTDQAAASSANARSWARPGRCPIRLTTRG